MAHNTTPDLFRISLLLGHESSLFVSLLNSLEAFTVLLMRFKAKCSGYQANIYLFIFYLSLSPLFLELLKSMATLRNEC